MYTPASHDLPVSLSLICGVYVNCLFRNFFIPLHVETVSLLSSPCSLILFLPTHRWHRIVTALWAPRKKMCGCACDQYLPLMKIYIYQLKSLNSFYILSTLTAEKEKEPSEVVLYTKRTPWRRGELSFRIGEELSRKRKKKNSRETFPY